MLHTRLSQIAADAAALDECVAYIEREIRPELETRRGSLGISVLADREGGVAILGSVWATGPEMSGSTDTEAPLRAELARLAGSAVTVDEYQVPICELFEQVASPVRGHAVRLTRIQVRPSQVDDAIEVIGDIAVPSLTQAPGFRDALLFAQPGSGRLISQTVWRDAAARAAAPSVAAIVRAELPGEAGSEIRAVEDYTLVFSTVREA